MMISAYEPQPVEYSFGNWVKRRRKALDLTQQELAQRVGCSSSLILKIESDERRPSRQMAELLAFHLAIPEDQQVLFLKVARREKTPEPLGTLSIADLPPPQSPSRIPLSAKPLIGREFELAEITRLIHEPQCRLLTLTGQGGIGKTHLAVHLVASYQNSNNKNQAAYVRLTPVAGREQTVTAIADALGIVLYTASDRASQLISYLLDREVILVLDNFEHLVADPGCIDLIINLLNETHKLKIIVTSRQPLHLQTEWVFDVQGLPVPKKAKPEDLKTSSAVVLFMQRANQAAFGFNPTVDDLLDIARICVLVEGLPLGIELAAAWVRTLACHEIAEEIQKSIDFLAVSVRDLPERHRSMRATIEYSWELLTPDEKGILKQLSIFRGGFDRQAAEAVANASLPALMALVSKSLLRRVEFGRYDIHELIRQFALDQLQQDEIEFRQAQARHSRYYAEKLALRGPALKGKDRPAAVTELISDLPNLRQAWHWASKHQQTYELCQSADTLFWLYESRSNCREGVPLFGEAVSALKPGQHGAIAQENWQKKLALGLTLGYQGFFLFRQGQHPQGRELLKSSLAILEEISDRDSSDVQFALSNTLAFLGTVSLTMGDFSGGDRLLHQGLAMKQALGDLWGCAYCLRQIGLSAYHRGEYAKSFVSTEQSLALSKELGNTWSLAASFNQLGMVAYSQEKIIQSQEFLAKGLEFSRASEDRASIAAALHGLGLVSLAMDEPDRARHLLEESVDLWREIGEQGSFAQTLTHLGEVWLKLGDHSQARTLFQHALKVAYEAQIIPVFFNAVIGEAEIQICEGKFDLALALLIIASQNASSSYATKIQAQKLCAGLEMQLTPEQVDMARAAAQNRTVDQLANNLLNGISSPIDQR